MKDILIFISATFIGAFIGIAVGFLLIGSINGWDTIRWFLKDIFQKRR